MNATPNCAAVPDDPDDQTLAVPGRESGGAASGRLVVGPALSAPLTGAMVPSVDAERGPGMPGAGTGRVPGVAVQRFGAAHALSPRGHPGEVPLDHRPVGLGTPRRS